MALDLKMHMNSKIHLYHVVVSKSKFKAAYKRKNEKRIVANYGIMANFEVLLGTLHGAQTLKL